MKENITRRFCRVAGMLVLVLATGTALFAAEKTDTDAKAATVNGTVISQSACNQEMDRIFQQSVRQGMAMDPDQIAQLKPKVLDNLIGRELIRQESAKRKIQTDEAMLNEQMDKIKKQFPSETEYQSALQKMNLTETEIKTRIREDLQIKQFIDQQIAAKVVVPETAVRAYYDSHPDAFKQPESIRASHILIKVEPGASPVQKDEARKQIEQVREKVQKGEDFGALAKKHSQGPSSTREGDLGYFKRGQMVEPFDTAAFALETGAVSDIVETQFGYHLIKMVDKKPETIVAFDQARSHIESYLRQTALQKELAQYVETLKKTAVIQKF